VLQTGGATGEVQLVDRAMAIFRACGVVALAPLLPAPTIERHRRALEQMLRPHLESRQRLRALILDVGRRHRSYNAYKRALVGEWASSADLHEELALSAGYAVRERSVG
jgi:hypothetical protein